VRWVKTGNGRVSERRLPSRGAGDRPTPRRWPRLASEVIAPNPQGGRPGWPTTRSGSTVRCRRARISPSRGKRSGRLEADARRPAESLELAAARIEAFHRSSSGGYELRLPGAQIGQRFSPVSRAARLRPRRQRPHPFHPAHEFDPRTRRGRSEVVAACAAPGGELPDVRAGGREGVGVSAVYRIGGAQAIAADGVRARSPVPKVDVIVRPRQRLRDRAQAELYGTVGIDMLAGPSELVGAADSNAVPAFAAAEPAVAAEHDEDAFVVLVTDSPFWRRRSTREIETGKAAKLPRRKSWPVRWRGRRSS